MSAEANVLMLDGSMSLQGHRALFASYDGPKREVT
jgi:prepilin-type processing-associated H-X9-DG protein